MNVSGTGGRYIIERKGLDQPERAALKPEDLLPPLRDVLENHRLEIENGCPVEDLAGLVQDRAAQLRCQRLRLPGVHRVSELRAG